jgi:RNA polymerase sigma factor (TIGR02999 family)
MMYDELQPDAPGQVTRILSNWNQLRDPASELLPLVYAQLRAIARNRMSKERAGHTLQATALVHEAYMKLVRLPESGVKLEGRARFFAAAAEAMRRILIDHARRRKAAKRGDPRVPLDELVQEPADLGALPDPDRLISLNDALDVLSGEDPRAAELVRLRYFAGLNADETAQVLNLSERTVHREWTYARARLHELLKED